MPEVHVFADPERLAEETARRVAAVVDRGVAARGRAVLGLSGGSTPRRLYERMGDAARAGGRWERTHLFWVDERFVPSTSPESNYHLVAETLLAHAGRFPGRLHPVPTQGMDREAAAHRYERDLRRLLDPAAGAGADLVLLGLGPDGHTASLFPGSPALGEGSRWVTDVDRAPQPPHLPRITTTLAFLNRAREVWFLVVGAEKAEILRTILVGPHPPDPSLPATLVRGAGPVRWFVDREAASKLPPGALPPP